MDNLKILKNDLIITKTINFNNKSYITFLLLKNTTILINLIQKTSFNLIIIRGKNSWKFYKSFGIILTKNCDLMITNSTTIKQVKIITKYDDDYFFIYYKTIPNNLITTFNITITGNRFAPILCILNCTVTIYESCTLNIPIWLTESFLFISTIKNISIIKSHTKNISISPNYTKNISILKNNQIINQPKEFELLLNLKVRKKSFIEWPLVLTIILSTLIILLFVSLLIQKYKPLVLYYILDIFTCNLNLFDYQRIDDFRVEFDEPLPLYYERSNDTPPPDI